MRLISNEELVFVAGGAIKIGTRPVYTAMGDFAGYENFEYDDGEEVQTVEIRQSRMTDAQKAAYDIRQFCDALAAEGFSNFTVSAGVPSSTYGGEAGGTGTMGPVEVNGKVTTSRTIPGATASGPCRP